MNAWAPRVSEKLRQRLAVLGERDFRVFFLGYVTSYFGTSMAYVALALAVLENEGSVSDLSYVMAARVLPTVLFLLGGGVLGDRLPRRRMMLISDSGRTLSQGGMAVSFLLGGPPLWVVLTLAASGGLAEALFRPSFDGLVPELVAKKRLPEANALIGLAQSVAGVSGPALAGILVAVFSPGAVLMVDAGSYLVSVLALRALRVSDRPAKSGSSMLSELRDGWQLFRSHTWLWTVTLQFTLFNLIVWAPYLVLLPASAVHNYGGSGALGVIDAVYGIGALLGGVLLLGRRPERPLVVATLITILWAAPSAALALRAPLVVVCGAALPAGVSSAVFNTLWLSVVQLHIPAESLSRVMSYVAFGAYSVGPVGLALAGPLAERTSVETVLAVGAVWQLVASSVVPALPAVRGLRPPWQNESVAPLAPLDGGTRGGHTDAAPR
jgi:MFS family permease